MDADAIKGMIEQHFEFGRSDPERGHEMYCEDAVLEFPQSGERFEGVDNFREWRSQYPADTSFEVQRVSGEGDHWAAELTVTYDKGEPNYGVSILELRDGRIAHESIYVAEGFAPPEWRARWRAEAG